MSSRLFSEEFTSEMRDPGLGGMGLRVSFCILLQPGMPGLQGATVKDCADFIEEFWRDGKRPPLNVLITGADLIP
jgi:hypothetical protein